MAYRRFVTYLFRYKNGIKAENCGFAKVEVRQDQVRMEIQIRGVKDKTNPVFLFISENSQLTGVYIGEIRIQNSTGREVFLFDAAASGNSPYGIDQMQGIYIKTTDGFLASQWVDEEIAWETFQVYEKPEEAPETPDSEQSDTMEEIKANPVTEEEPASFQMETNEPSELHVTQTAQTAALPSQKNNPRISSYMDTWEKNWKKFSASHPVFCPFDEASDVIAVKMDLRDFKILPKEYLSLANNHFLLHGYFNYKYLIFGYKNETPRKWFIGVPGTFHNQEQLLAGLFGFGEFRSKHITKHKTGEFGYWYRYLEL